MIGGEGQTIAIVGILAYDVDVGHVVADLGVERGGHPVAAVGVDAVLEVVVAADFKFVDGVGCEVGDGGEGH